MNRTDWVHMTGHLFKVQSVFNFPFSDSSDSIKLKSVYLCGVDGARGIERLKSDDEFDGLDPGCAYSSNAE